MAFQTFKTLIAIAILLSSVIPNNVLGQSQTSQRMFPDTTQELLKKSQKNILSRQKLAERKTLLRRLSPNCRPSNKPLPAECRRGNRPVQSAKQNISRHSEQVTRGGRVSSNATQALTPGVAAGGGGITIGVATMGLTTFLAVAGATILSLLAVGGYGDDSSGGAASSATSTD